MKYIYSQPRLWLGAMAICFALTGCGQSSLNAAKPRQVSAFLYAQTAELRAEQISNVSYGLQFDLDKQSESFSGVTEISFDLAADNRDDLSIDLGQGTVHSITKNGMSVPFSYDRWFISIPATELAAGRNTLVISYSHPYSNDGSGLHRFIDPENGDIYLFTDFEPYDANRLFPHFDQPDLKASYSLQVSAPRDWQVISATRETSIEQIKITGPLLDQQFSRPIYFRCMQVIMLSGKTNSKIFPCVFLPVKAWPSMLKLMSGLFPPNRALLSLMTTLVSATRSVSMTRLLFLTLMPGLWKMSVP